MTPIDQFADELDRSLERLWRGEPAEIIHYGGFPGGMAETLRKFLLLAADDCAIRQNTLLCNSKFGQHRLERVLGRGGTSVVYLARDESGNRVAVKVFLAVAEGCEAAFETESRALLRIDHPGIVKVHGGGRAPNGICYLVREFVDGASLLELANARGRAAGCMPLNLWERVALLCRICEAVAYAHQRSVIHGDLKPANIFVTREGAPKLLDFGLAKMRHLLSPKTSDGTPLGTWRYMSPEQARGETLDERSDVYALGVVAFELLTGSAPLRFGSSDSAARVRVICTELPRKPSEINGALRGPLEAALMRALEKDPARRYRNADAMLNDLARILRRSGHGAVLSVRFRRRAFTPFERIQRIARDVLWQRVVELRKPR